MMIKIIRTTIDVNKKLPKFRQKVNLTLLDSTTEADIEKHKAEDVAEALLNATRFKALQAAVQLGLDDMEAGRYKEFGSKASLRKHLKSIIAKAATAKKT